MIVSMFYQNKIGFLEKKKKKKKMMTSVMRNTFRELRNAIVNRNE